MEYKITFHFISGGTLECQINENMLQNLLSSIDQADTRFIQFGQKGKPENIINVNNITSIHFEEAKDKDVEQDKE